MIDLIESKSNMTCSYIVAASPDPQPRDDVLYKDSVKHSSRALSGPSNTKPLKHRQKTNRRQKPNHARSWGPPKRPFSRSCFLSSVVNCAVGFNCLDLQSTTPRKVTHSTAGASLIPVCSLLVAIMGCALGVELGDASPWRCWLPPEKRGGSVDRFPFKRQGS